MLYRLCAVFALPVLVLQEFRGFKIREIEEKTHNVKRFRVDLPSPEDVAGMKTASCIVIRGTGRDGNPVVRPYTPTTTNDTKVFPPQPKTLRYMFIYPLTLSFLICPRLITGHPILPRVKISEVSIYMRLETPVDVFSTVLPLYLARRASLPAVAEAVIVDHLYSSYLVGIGAICCCVRRHRVSTLRRRCRVTGLIVIFLGEICHRIEIWAVRHPPPSRHSTEEKSRVMREISRVRKPYVVEEDTHHDHQLFIAGG